MKAGDSAKIRESLVRLGELANAAVATDRAKLHLLALIERRRRVLNLVGRPGIEPGTP